MPGAAGLVVGQVLWSFGVVEDQQPAPPAAQLGQDQLDRVRHGRLVGRPSLSANWASWPAMRTGCSALTHQTRS